MINVIGAGLSGISAAITIAKCGKKCNLFSVQPSERAQSVLAEGGINAALDNMGEGDTVEEHFLDTMKGGVFLEDEQTIKDFTAAAPNIVMKLKALGVPFHLNGDKIAQRNFGGQKKKRTAFSKSSTGKVIMTALIDEARKYEDKGLIARFSHHEVIDLSISGGAFCGVTVRDIYTGKTAEFFGATILCVGGMNGIFPEVTTGTTQNNGNVQSIAFSKGVEFSDLEFIQFHPTTIAVADKRMLVSEAARGEGGRLFTVKNGKPWYFMEEKYPVLKNLMPRDVVSRECYLAMHDGQTDGKVYLDLTGLPEEVKRDKLSDLFEEITAYKSINPSVTPVPVEPGIHYFMGGISVDQGHRTNVKGLYAAGECASIYHGANRLGGNSMLGAIYGGTVAAKTAVDENYECAATDSGSHELPFGYAERADGSPSFNKKLRDILFDGLGIIRDEKGLISSLEKVEKLILETKNETEMARATLGKAMILSAIERKESRGAHYRADFPEQSEEYKAKSTAVFSGGEIVIKFKKA